MQDVASLPDPGNLPITIYGLTVAESPKQDDSQVESAPKVNGEELSFSQKLSGFRDSNAGYAIDYLKDIAMDLAFKPVTQQDSETHINIALDTKDDSASMKIIAVLTMVLHPATATSSFCDMNCFNLSDEGYFQSSPKT
ncbi:uncharacterized protein BKA55DRAFT_686303 [Fusarium redolens]|uniref:Uncharacterized protein n=1 Tax=Fusarium redolens TaxID=48865 RepID=A0A9P9HNE2_FUSRE|nr:uncharacterized protein BKA55DRAFT_686303 [Fusarium redolens]KAH7260720.1 hypothetical protein BKA55DRAFT_686303 [Fusarium redolens]